MQVRDLLVAAHIERTDDDRVTLKGGSDLTVGLELLVFGRKLLGIHEQELGAEQTDSLCVVLESSGNVVGATDVASKDLLHAVGGDGLLAAIGLESLLLGSEGLGAGGVIGKGCLVGIGNDNALGAVDDDGHAVLELGAGILNRKNRRNLESASNDGGMRGATAGLGDDSGNVLLVDGGGHGRREVMHADDGAGRQHGKVDDLATQQLGQKTGADVGDVGSAQTEHLVVHGEEHVLKHGGGVDECLLSAGAGVDSLVDLIAHAGVLSQRDVADHNLGLVLAHRDLHGLSLSLGLLAEDVESLSVALLLGGSVLNGVRLKAQIGLDSNGNGADTDTLGSVYSLVHADVLSLWRPRRAPFSLWCPDAAPHKITQALTLRGRAPALCYLKLQSMMCKLLAQATLDELDSGRQGIGLVLAIATNLNLDAALDAGCHQGHGALAIDLASRTLVRDRDNLHIASELAHGGREQTGGTHMQALRVDKGDLLGNHDDSFFNQSRAACWQV